MIENERSIQDIGALTREIFFNTRKEISYLRAAIYVTSDDSLFDVLRS